MSRLYNEDKVIRILLNREYRSCKAEYNDLYQLAWLGYMKAVKNFDSEKSSRMSLRYAEQYMRNEINKAVKRRPDSDAVEYIDELHHGELHESPEEEMQDNETSEELRRHISKLNITHRKVLGLRYLSAHPKTLQQVSDELGLGSRQRVLQIETKAIELLRGMFNEDIDPGL